MIRTKFVPAALRACAAFALVVLATRGGAQTILDVGGFEAASGYSTTFNPMLPGTYVGQLEGQVPFASYPNGTWQVPVGGTGTSTATVVSGVNSPLGPAGTQAVELVKGNADARWGVHNSTFPSPGRTQICIDWDMMVLGPAGTPGTDFGPFFGVETYYDQGGLPYPRHGWLGVDGTTGAVLIGEAGTGNFKSPDGLTAVAFGDWNSFRIVLDFPTNSYVSFLNGVQLGPAEGFVDGVIPFFTDAPLAVLSEGTPWASLTGTAYVDNFSIHEGLFCIIPEPGTIVLAVLGLTGIVAGRRRWA
ncbi:MAG: PEP-CTERM sorting domain-containing protein [Pirellulales bacterium]|nr:PEP-CTERM sorting domain-containing protein [Pirellulales bacterium]